MCVCVCLCLCLCLCLCVCVCVCLGLSVLGTNECRPSSMEAVEPVWRIPARRHLPRTWLSVRLIPTIPRSGQRSNPQEARPGLVTWPLGLVTWPLGLVTWPLGLVTSLLGLVTWPPGLVSRVTQKHIVSYLGSERCSHQWIVLRTDWQTVQTWLTFLTASGTLRYASPCISLHHF